MVWTRLLSLVLWLGPVRFKTRYWILRVPLVAIRHSILLGLSGLMVWGAFMLAGPSPRTFDSLKALSQTTNQQLADLKPKVKDDKLDPSALSFEALRYDPRLPEAMFYKVEMHFKSGDRTVKRSLLEVKPALETMPGVMAVAEAGWWPFRTVSFPTGAYVGSAMVVEVNKDLSSSDVDRVRRLIDPVVENLPSPKDRELIWARRLVGEIQLGCFVLAAYGLLLVVFSWLSRVLPNVLLREESGHQLKGIAADRLVDDEGSAVWRLRKKTAPPHPSASPADDVIPSPWMGGKSVRGSAAEFERFYAELGDETRRRLSWGLTDPLIPLTGLRRLAYMALRSSPNGETVPGLMSVEADGIYEGFMADNRPIEYLIWAIPTLGFVGTVLGIGQALSATVDIESSVISTQVDASSAVGSEIGLAFDTTFVALLLSFVLMLLYTGLQQAQELMVSREKQLVLKEIFQPRNIMSFKPNSGLESTLATMRDQLGWLTAQSSRANSRATENAVDQGPRDDAGGRTRRPSRRGSMFIALGLLVAGGLMFLMYRMGGFSTFAWILR